MQKKTLFKNFFGNENIAIGEIIIKSKVKLVYVQQKIENGEISLLDLIIGADTELVYLRAI
jgi:hypothetical protein